MDLTIVHAYWTVAMLVIFVGIWVWAWSSKRKTAFDEAARLPLEEDTDIASTNAKTEEKKHG